MDPPIRETVAGSVAAASDTPAPHEAHGVRRRVLLLIDRVDWARSAVPVVPDSLPWPIGDIAEFGFKLAMAPSHWRSSQISLLIGRGQCDDRCEDSMRAVIVNDRRPRLVLMCGLPGAGKTTLAKQLEREMPAARLCPDERLADESFSPFDEESRSRVEQHQWNHAQDLLAAGTNVILENGFWGRAERDQKRLRARELAADVELRYLAVPIADLERRIAARNREPGSVVLTSAMLREWQCLFEIPTQTELDLFDPPLRSW